MSIDKRKVKKALGLSIAAVGTVFVGLSIIFATVGRLRGWEKQGR